MAFRTLGCGLLLSLAIAPTLATAANAEEQALIDLENRLSAANKAGDVDFVAKLEDENYTLTNSRAKVSHRADDLEELRKRDPKYDVFHTHDMQARVYGDTGVVIGIVSLKGTSESKPFEADMRFTDTFVRQNGEWKIVAAQVTKIPE